MVEIEIKLALPSPTLAKSLLKSARFRLTRRRVFEVNQVFDLVGTPLRLQGLLLRLRAAGSTSTLTFKGQAIPGPHKRRPEFETRVADFDSTAAIFTQLGYLPVFRYEKYRTEYARPGEPGHALLDETPIGTFLELEGPARWIDSVARSLGKSRRDYITASYAGLYLEDCKARRIPPGNMVFR